MEATAEITTAVKNVPALRFQEFEGEWKSDDFGKIVEKSKAKYNPDKETIVYPCIELESLSQEAGILLETFNSKDQLSIKNKFKKGEVLYGKLRPYLKKYLIAPFDGVCSSEIWVFNGKKVSNEFLYTIVQGEKFNYFANISSGSKMPRADWDYVSSSPVAYPTLPEQQKIASFLTIVDDKIQQLSKKKELLEKYKKGVMQQIFSQQIRFKDNNGNDFPEWKSKRLDSFISKFIVPMRDKPKELNGEIPWCRIEDFDGKYLSESKSGQGVSAATIKEMNLKVYPVNTLIVSCSANLGFCAIIKRELVTNQTFIGLVPDVSKIDVEYLYYIMILSARKLNTLSSGTTISYLSRQQFENFEVILPCVEEQTKIANFLSSIDNKINYTSKQLEQAQQFKKGLLQQLFV